MPDTGAPWNIPYVAASDLVKDWPTDNQQQMEAIANILPRGISYNVVQATKTDVFSTTSTSPVDITGLSCTITPSSASSKVLVLAAVSGSNSALAENTFVVLDRGGTEVFKGDASGSSTPSTVNLPGQSTGDVSRFATTPAIIYLDSPATASAVTYKLRVFTSSTGTAYINRAGRSTDDATNPLNVSSLTVIEVAV